MHVLLYLTNTLWSEWSSLSGMTWSLDSILLSDTIRRDSCFIPSTSLALEISLLSLLASATFSPKSSTPQQKWWHWLPQIHRRSWAYSCRCCKTSATSEYRDSSGPSCRKHQCSSSIPVSCQIFVILHNVYTNPPDVNRGHQLLGLCYGKNGICHKKKLLWVSLKVKRK